MRYFNLLNYLCREEREEDRFTLLTPILVPQLAPEKIFVTRTGDVYRGTDEQVVKQVEKRLCFHVHNTYILFLEKHLEIKERPRDDQNIDTTTRALLQVLGNATIARNIVNTWSFHHQQLAQS